MKQHVILTMYDAKSKSHKQYDALVLGAERPMGENKPALHLAYVNPERLEQTNGINWTDSIERVLSVPHEDHKQNEAFHYEEVDTPDHLQNVLQVMHETSVERDQQITQLHERIAQLEKYIADKDQRVTREAEVAKTLESAEAGRGCGIVYENPDQPSTSADLDAVSEEEKARQATAGQTADTPIVQ